MRVAEGGVDVAIRFLQDGRLGTQFGAIMLVDARLLGREQRDAPLFDRNLDQVGGVFREVCVLGKDDRHRLADIAHEIFCQHRLPVGLERLEAGQPERDRRNVRNVCEGPHRVYAGQRARCARVDRFDFAVRHGRAHHAHVPLAGK